MIYFFTPQTSSYIVIERGIIDIWYVIKRKKEKIKSDIWKGQVGLHDGLVWLASTLGSQDGLAQWVGMTDWHNGSVWWTGTAGRHDGTTSRHDGMTSWHDGTTSRYDGTTGCLLRPNTTCSFRPCWSACYSNLVVLARPSL